MDAAAKPEKKLEVAVKNLKIDVPSQASKENMSGPKVASQSDATSCISSVDATSSVKESEVDHESVMSEQGMHYYGYYYPGSNCLFGDWGAQNYSIATDGLETQHSMIQPDNGSVVYYFPGFQPGYTSYNPFLPGTMIGLDGQYLAQQSYYSSPVSSEVHVSPGIFSQPVAYGPELLPMYAWDPSLLFQDGLQTSMLSLDPLDAGSKFHVSSKSKKFSPSKTFQTLKATPEAKSSSQAPVVPQTPIFQNQSDKHAKQAAAVVVSKANANSNKFSSFANHGKDGLLYTNNLVSSKENNRSWVGHENLKARNKLNGTVDFDLLSEQNRGPRTNGTNNAVKYGVKPPESLSDVKNDDNRGLAAIVNKDQFNLPDFPAKYEHALFFVIKSYSEDDIHKSIKYNVWASTRNGNKRLDNAFQVAQEKMAETGSKCPVFLFFSVNASGQFCGVAEMTGRVDFSKNMDFWQQDKWNGAFPVKWHVIKDIPNPQFRHIILENNDNKPVTNSRDTQEVKFAQGTEMLNIFKSYYSKTSILDDFGFYENRQKAIEAKRNKPLNPSLVHSLPKYNETSQGLKVSDSTSKVSPPEVVESSSENSKGEPQTVVEVKE